MPSTSKKQHKFMAAIAHNPAFAKKVGVPQSVGKDFNDADKGKKFGKGGTMATKKKMDPKMMAALMAARQPAMPPAAAAAPAPMAPPGGMGGMRKGGMTKKMASGGMAKDDIKQDKAIIKKAFGMHDKQEHKGEHTDLSKLKKGGMAAKKMASGGETMGPRTMAKDIEKGSNKLTKFGESAVQKRGKTKGMNLGDSGKTEPIDIGTKAKMIGMKKGGSVFRSSADGIASKGKTRGMEPKMKGKTV